MTQPFHGLIIEDDPDIANLVALQIATLNGSSYHTMHIKEAKTYVQKHNIDLIILDLSLPDGDGLDFCRDFRAQHQQTPILIISARSDELDRVLGLELGADDYLNKPFGLAELRARIKALIRRYQFDATETEHTNIMLGALEIDVRQHQVFLNQDSINLTAKEFDLLKLFAQHPGRVFSRVELLEKVWSLYHEGYEHTVNSHLNRLRKKLEADPAHPQILETVWGVGYRLNTGAL